MYDNETDTLLQEEEEVLQQAAKEEEDLYNALENLTNSKFDSATEEATKKDIKDKLIRFKEITIKKTDIQIQTSVALKQLKAEVERLKSDSVLREQVVESQMRELDEKDKDKVTLAKEVEALKSDIKEKDKFIKELEEATEADPEDRDVVVEVSQNHTMNKDLTGHKCNACDKTFRQSNDLDKHMNAKHTEKQCNYCDKICEKEADLVNYHSECIDVVLRTVPCQKCEKVFTNFAIRRHKEVCKGAKEFDCPECGMVCSSPVAMKKHYDNEHKLEPVKSREVCYHWRRGNCIRTNCRFAHVGHQNKNLSESTRKDTTKVPACKNGAACDWLKKGKFSYFHAQVGVQRPWVTKEKSARRGSYQGDQGDQGRQEGRGHQRDQEVQGNQGSQNYRTSKFDGRCDKLPNCPYNHYLEDFPPLQVRRQGVRRNSTNQRGNK